MHFRNLQIIHRIYPTNSLLSHTIWMSHDRILVIEGKDGAGELLRLPVGNDMDMSNLCEAVNRLI